MTSKEGDLALRSLAFYVTLQLLDAAITVYGVNAGLLVETNPLVQPANIAHLALKAAVTALTTFLIWVAYKKAVADNSQRAIHLVHAATTGLMLWYAFVVANNLFNLLF